MTMMMMMQLQESEEEKKEEEGGEAAEKKDDSIVYADLDKSAMSEGDSKVDCYRTHVDNDCERYSPSEFCDNIKEKLCSDICHKLDWQL